MRRLHFCVRCARLQSERVGAEQKGIAQLATSVNKTTTSSAQPAVCREQRQETMSSLLQDPDLLCRRSQLATSKLPPVFRQRGVTSAHLE